MKSFFILPVVLSKRSYLLNLDDGKDCIQAAKERFCSNESTIEECVVHVNICEMIKHAPEHKDAAHSEEVPESKKVVKIDIPAPEPYREVRVTAKDIDSNFERNFEEFTKD